MTADNIDVIDTQTFTTWACIADFYGERVEYYLCVDYEIWWTECITNITQSRNSDCRPEHSLWKLKNPTEPYSVRITHSITVEKI